MQQWQDLEKSPPMELIERNVARSQARQGDRHRVHRETFSIPHHPYWVVRAVSENFIAWFSSQTRMPRHRFMHKGSATKPLVEQRRPGKLDALAAHLRVVSHAGSGHHLKASNSSRWQSLDYAIVAGKS